MSGCRNTKGKSSISSSHQLAQIVGGGVGSSKNGLQEVEGEEVELYNRTLQGCTEKD